MGNNQVRFLCFDPGFRPDQRNRPEARLPVARKETSRSALSRSKTIRTSAKRRSASPSAQMALTGLSVCSMRTMIARSQCTCVPLSVGPLNLCLFSKSSIYHICLQFLHQCREVWARAGIPFWTRLETEVSCRSLMPVTFEVSLKRADHKL